MQISSWYTEHDKPLPGLFLTQDYLFPNKLFVSSARWGWYWDGALGWEEEMGKGFWTGGGKDQTRKQRLFQSVKVWSPSTGLSIGTACLDSFSWSIAVWSPQHCKARSGYQLFGKWCLLFPACYVSQLVKADKGIRLEETHFCHVPPPV